MEPFEFLFVLSITVFTNVEFFAVGIVPGIDAHFFHVFSRFHGGGGKEVDIGNKGNVKTGRTNFFGNESKRFSCPYIGCGNSNNFTPCFRQFNGLSNGGVHIHSVSGGHGLDPHRVSTPGLNIPNRYDPRFSSDRMKTRGAVGGRHALAYSLKKALEIKECDIQHEGKK